MSKITVPTYINLVDRGNGRAPKGAARISPDDNFWGGWIEEEDYRLHSWIDEAEEDKGYSVRYANITVDMDEEMESLLRAHRNGDVVCYDSDPSVVVMADEDGGCPELEIFWAVKYRGGIGICQEG